DRFLQHQSSNGAGRGARSLRATFTRSLDAENADRHVRALPVRRGDPGPRRDADEVLRVLPAAPSAAQQASGPGARGTAPRGLPDLLVRQDALPRVRQLRTRAAALLAGRVPQAADDLRLSVQDPGPPRQARTDRGGDLPRRDP